MKKLLLIATGGTIASKKTEAGLAPAMSARELLACVPEIASACKVEELQLFNLDSTNLCGRHWLKIASAIREHYSEYDGFVVTHGTDTMAYTAAALSYLIQDSPKPVVLTGSQKSAYLRDTDARKNLADAFFYCADENATGVHIVFDGEVILGTRAKKTRTKSYNAFSSIDYPAIARMREGKPFYYIQEEKGKGPIFYDKLNENVFVLKMIPGMQAEIFDYLTAHCDGLVIESFGAGGLPDYGNGEFYTRLKAFLAAGKTAVLTTQVEREGSDLDIYEVGHKLRACGNVIEAKCMTLEATVTKLMWALGQAKGEKAEALFTRPVAMDIF